MARPIVPEKPVSPTPPRAGSEIHTLLGQGSTFEGKLAFDGTARVDGKLIGEVHCADTLVVGETAELQAECHVGTIIVEGSITGNIKATKAVELHAPARVRGNIETPSLFIDRGVNFDGSCKMSTGDAKYAPKDEAKKPTSPLTTSSG